MHIFWRFHYLQLLASFHQFHTTSLSQEMKEIRQQISLMDERKAEMKNHVPKLEQEHNEIVP